MNNHSINLFKYYRRETINVYIGNSGIGGNNPIRIQSMTTSDTMDTASIVNESIRMINSGCEFVRITTPSIREANILHQMQQKLLLELLKKLELILGIMQIRKNLIR